MGILAFVEGKVQKHVFEQARQFRIQRLFKGCRNARGLKTGGFSATFRTALTLPPGAVPKSLPLILRVCASGMARDVIIIHEHKAFSLFNRQYAGNKKRPLMKSGQANPQTLTLKFNNFLHVIITQLRPVFYHSAGRIMAYDMKIRAIADDRSPCCSQRYPSRRAILSTNHREVRQGGCDPERGLSAICNIPTLRR